MPLATTRQGSLHYEIVDQMAPARAPREAVLFHHGIGASAGIWTGWFSALADAHRLVSFDMRGYGRSHIPAADFAWSLEQMVDDLFAVAEAARVDPQCPARADRHRPFGPAEGHRATDLAAASRRQSVHPGAGHGRAAPA